MATTFCSSRQVSGLAGKTCARRNAVPRASRLVVCASSSDLTEKMSQYGKIATSTVAAAALAAVVGFGGMVDEAKADIAGLTPCSESKQYAKKQKKAIATLTRRLEKYESDSAPAIALQATIDKTNKRFEFYANKGLLCGTDGLPHLIADPGYAFKFGHTGEVFIPAVLFVYIAGWIGYSGRLYLEQTRSASKEYILDVPLALNCTFKGLGWPLSATQELIGGSLLEKDENITVSPR